MGRFLDLALVLLTAHASFGRAQLDAEIPEGVEDPSKSPAIAVTVDTTFPNAEIFGIKLVNGQETEALLSFTNEEPDPITVQFVGGSLWTGDLGPAPRIVRNLTTHQYAVQIPAGEKQSLPYRFQVNMHPQDLRLNLAAVINTGNTFLTLPAYNGTVSVVEPDSSFFDPQLLFLYVFLLAAAVGVGYFFYTVWILPYFPQQKRKTNKKTPRKSEVAVTADVDSPAVATGSKAFNEEWIPNHHIQRPEARRVKSSGRPKSRGKPE
ncbi:hypothetical protein B0A52_01416 [Exophiala mesophila]|uniref:Uncharacterized protein n=1 Tax=Exophiala mesophila TaxID=212818 RepID=A0A438NHC1_EXOME|nr:hypothetical protein B0A52_01416 [Exophiala mesophila]